MSLRSEHLVAVVGVAAAIAAAGCGGGGKSAGTTSTRSNTPTQNAVTAKPVHLTKHSYEAKMQSLGNRLGKSINGLYPLASGSKGSATAEQTVVKLEHAKTVVKGVLAQLQRIAPPQTVAAQHRLLVSGVRLLVSQLGSLINDTQTGDVRDFVSGSNFTSSLQMINAAANAMTDRGYNILGPTAAINP